MNMTTVFSQMAVLFLVLALGYIGSKAKIMNAESNKMLSRLILNITVPGIILSSVMDGSVTASGNEALAFMLYVLLSLVLTVIVAWPVPFIFRTAPEDRGLTRFLIVFGNSGFMGYPVIQAIFGNGALFYVTLIGIPVNVLLYSLGIVLTSGKKEKFDARRLLTPTVISSIAAIVIFAFKIPIPKVIVDTTTLVGQITTPGAMLVIGSTLAGIPIRDVFREKKVYPVVFVKLIVIPVVTWLVMRLIVADTQVLGILIVQAAMPSAMAAAMLTLQYGGNDKLASKTIFLTTLFSVLTIPLLLYFLF